MGNIQDSANTIERSIETLDRLADAFITTGNSHVANELNMVAYDLRLAASHISESTESESIEKHNEAKKIIAQAINDSLSEIKKGL